MAKLIDLRTALDRMRDYYFCENCFLYNEGQCGEDFFDGNCYYEYLIDSTGLNTLLDKTQNALQEIHNKIYEERNDYPDYIRDLQLEAERPPQNTDWA